MYTYCCLRILRRGYPDWGFSVLLVYCLILGTVSRYTQSLIVGEKFFIIIPPLVTQCPEWDNITRRNFTICASLYTQISTGHHNHINIVPSHTRPRREKFCSPKKLRGPTCQRTNIHSEHSFPIHATVGAKRHPRTHAPTRKYHCTLRINPSHIANIPHTSSLHLHISFAEWNDTTREPYIQQPLHRHLRLQANTDPTQNPTTMRRSRLTLTSTEKGSTCSTRYHLTPQPESSPPNRHRTNQEILSNKPV